MKAFNSTKNFFELLRFDFLMDEAFNLYLMEVRKLYIALFSFSINSTCEYLDQHEPQYHTNFYEIREKCKNKRENGL
jgi:Tubulin-tyrosine ligase family